MIDKYELALEEIKNNYKLQCEGVDICKQSARSSINSSGLIIALISLLETKNGNLINLGKYNILFWALIIITILIFVVMIITYVCAIKPIEMRAPVKSSKENFEKVFFSQDDRKSIEILIEKYINTIEGNDKKLIKVSNLATLTNYLAALSIIFAFILFIVGVFYG